MPDDMRELWQEQKTEKVTITLNEIRREAWKFERRVYRQNMRGYVAAAVAIAWLSPQLWRNHGWHLTPAALMLAGVLYMVYQLHRRGAAREVRADLGLSASIESHRRELERQLDALRAVWAWYLLPFVPGAAVYVVAVIDRGPNQRMILSAVIFVILFAGGSLLNWLAARKLDRRINELKALERDLQ
jgi:positive regulator of sigma E activity